MIHTTKFKDLEKKRFKFDEEDDPSVNILNLLDSFSLKGNIKLFTNKSLKSNSSDQVLYKQYPVSSVSVNGTISYVKSKLNGSFKLFQKSLEEYFDSGESLTNKIYQLSKARISIQEFLLFNNSNDPVLINMSSNVQLCNTHGDKYIKVRWEQCKLSPAVVQEIRDHIYLRNTYVGLLNDLCSLYIEKLNVLVLEKNKADFKMDLNKENQLLQVWVGLNLTGFIDHLDVDQKSLHRKTFFEMFKLLDRNYNDKNKVLKKTKEPKKTSLLTEMIEKIRNYK
jgi:hypothetical protein